MRFAQFATLSAALLLALSEPVWCSEVGTFTAADRVACRLFGAPTDRRLTRLEAEFRTSRGNSSALISLKNSIGEQFAVLVASDSRLAVRLAWLPGGSKDDSSDYIDGEEGYAPVESDLASSELILDVPDVGVGEWRRLTVSLPSSGVGNGSLMIDGRSVGQLPANFSSARFDWNGTTQVIVGGGFSGCLANVSLGEGSAPVPLHSGSELLNSTADGVSVNIAESRLPEGGPGCRQSACPCLPNGACVYRRWDDLLMCNCSLGYDGARCEREWNTCEHLEAGRECMNGGLCENQPGPLAYNCSCHPAGQYLGSRCQSLNHCRNPVTCQNGANCSLTGDPEGPSELDYMCVCTSGFTGRNCTDPVVQPETGGSNTDLIIGVTVSVIAVLLLLIAGLVAMKVIRDRRREFGAYKPSQREGANSANAGQAMIGLDQVMRPPREERFI